MVNKQTKVCLLLLIVQARIAKHRRKTALGLAIVRAH